MNVKRIVKAAAAQLAPVIDNCLATTEKVCEYIEKAAQNGAEIIVFPETFIPNYPYFSFVKPAISLGKDHLKLYDEAVAIPGPVTQAVSVVAKKFGIVVVLGVNEKDYGTLYNTQIIFDATGEIVLRRRKITP